MKVPLRRTHLADSLKSARTDRQGFVDLGAFLAWLWKLTVVPERYCRDMCMWLMDKLATLHMEHAMQTGVHHGRKQWHESVGLNANPTDAGMPFTMSLYSQP